HPATSSSVVSPPCSECTNVSSIATSDFCTGFLLSVLLHERQGVVLPHLPERALGSLRSVALLAPHPVPPRRRPVELHALLPRLSDPVVNEDPMLGLQIH